MSTGLDTNYLDRCDDKEEIDRLRAEIAAQSTEVAIQAKIIWQRDTEIENLRAKLAEHDWDIEERMHGMCEENARLKEEIALDAAKLATMVCGKCKGEKRVFENRYDMQTVPCLTCQPKGGEGK